MKTIAILAVLFLSACASAPQHVEQSPQPVTHHENICSGGALALYALTKPWALKDCISGEEK